MKKETESQKKARLDKKIRSGKATRSEIMQAIRLIKR